MDMYIYIYIYVFYHAVLWKLFANCMEAYQVIWLWDPRMPTSLCHGVDF
jgi:hypothetical protein